MARRAKIEKHQYTGLTLVFAGATLLGFAFYTILLAANRLLLEGVPLLSGNELLIFPLFFGIGTAILVKGVKDYFKR